jgi:4-hydroxybenzoate polyprenyltransferase
VRRRVLGLSINATPPTVLRRSRSVRPRSVLTSEDHRGGPTEPQTASLKQSVLPLLRLRYPLAAGAATCAWGLAIAGHVLPLSVLVASATALSVYLGNAATDVVEDSVNDPSLARLVVAHPTLTRALTIASAATAIACALAVGHLLVPVTSALAVGFLYSAGIGRFRLKSNPLTKVLAPATIWTMATVGMSVAGVHAVRAGPLCLAAVHMFVAVFSISTFNDLRDQQGDRIAGVLSVPICLGANRTIGLIVALNAGAACAVVAIVSHGGVGIVWLLLIANNAYLCTVFYFSGSLLNVRHDLVVAPEAAALSVFGCVVWLAGHAA